MAPSKSFPPLSQPEQIDSERIAPVLGRDPVQIAEIEVSPGPQTIISLTHKVKITDADGASGFPSALFVKYRKPDIGDKYLAAGPHEVRFYGEVLERLPERDALSVPRCFDAAHDPESGEWRLMLEDLSETHFTTPWPVPPTVAYCEMAVDCLAKAQGRLWNHPRLDVVAEFPPPRPAESDLRERWREALAAINPFLDFLGDRISVGRGQLFRRVRDEIPLVWATRLRCGPRAGRASASPMGTPIRGTSCSFAIRRPRPYIWWIGKATAWERRSTTWPI